MPSHVFKKPHVEITRCTLFRRGGIRDFSSCVTPRASMFLEKNMGMPLGEVSLHDFTEGEMHTNNKQYGATAENEAVIYLQMELKKGSFSEDDNGDFIFDVEASNENLDLEQQAVLQEALLNSKDYFLSNGVISKDHLHQEIVGEGEHKKIIYNEDFIIGEPLQVYTDGSSTRVRGKLYKTNEYAKKFIELLKDGSTRVKASVGGLIPLVRKTTEHGIEIGKVVSVLWNDLALTIAPVNPTVSPAYMVKSLNSLEFVKALSAGCGTDANSFTGGRALVPENGTTKKTNDDIIADLIEAISTGTITTEEDVAHYCAGLNIDAETALHYIHAILSNEKIMREVVPMSKALWEEMLQKMQKSFGGGKGKEESKKPEPEAPEKPEEDDTLDIEDIDEDDDDGKTKKEMKDASRILESLKKSVDGFEAKLEAMNKALASITEQNAKTAEMQETMGKSLNMTMEHVDKLVKEPVPRSSAVSALEAVMAKGGKLGTAEGGMTHKQFTAQQKNQAMDVLLKAVSDGEISVVECGKIETQINKSLRDPHFQLDQQYIKLLQQKMK